MNAWQLAAGLLILAIPGAGLQAWSWDRYGKRNWRSLLCWAWAWGCIVTAGVVLVYSGVKG